LLAIKGISEAKLDKILDAVQKLVYSGFITGAQFLVKRRNIIKVTTGSLIVFFF
jgi:meiotic recombination protein DMC1